ncbi:unnamed protein product [Bursaphelenchus xylophilus]|uniref:(pine wood nematode) hypothetical protein n=1 Tax=Bursaphelenchus xylophilus TaxID=6326 RepID=A0A1I7RVN6_BURXY|nr:unnamed protein product [Bursaphelenchus xylophilus]CAG9081933.1 unnamed protein product [Bursaphelenchus xylophilus]
MNTPPKPLNIMADPRIFRGSVVARQREQMIKMKQEMERRQQDERWRASVVRTRLKIAMNESSFMSDDQPEMQAMPNGVLPEDNLVQKFGAFKLARLNGPVGVRPTFTLNQGEFPQSIDAKLPPAALTDQPSHRRSFHEAQQYSLFPSSSRTVASPSLPALPSLPPGVQSMQSRRPSQFNKNVRFLPLHRAQTDKHLMAGSMPPLLPGQVDLSGPLGPSRRGGGRFRGRSQSQKNLPVIAGQRHTKSWDDVEDLTDPPPTAVVLQPMNNVEIQTEDFLAFDETFEPLVREMVNGAIADGIRKLMEEEDLERYQQQVNQLMDAIDEEKRRNQLLQDSIQHQTEVQEALEAEKKTANKKLDALDCRRMAIEFVDDLQKKCMGHLMNRNLIKDDRFMRDVAADTRQLQADSMKLQRTVEEVRKDFFPFVYQQAEQVFVHQLTSSYLKDALFSKNKDFRHDAYQRLNEQIKRYNHILGRKSSGSLDRLDSPPSPTPPMSAIRIRRDVF